MQRSGLVSGESLFEPSSEAIQSIRSHGIEAGSTIRRQRHRVYSNRGMSKLAVLNQQNHLAVLRQSPISCQQAHGFQQTLGYKNAVKWITVMQWEF